MKLYHYLPLVSLAPAMAWATPSAKITEAPAILPKPNKLEVSGETGFALSAPLKINAPKGTFNSAIVVLKNGLPGGIAQTTSEKDALTIKLDESLGKEAYNITATPDGITLTAGDAAGAFYGAQSLVQAVVQDTAGKSAVPALKIEDKPRFVWRGLMLDPCRHFIQPENMKRMIDLMAMHKLNTLHWHLTEDQGWRIEIKKYPKLTEIGAVREQSPVMGNRNKGDGKKYGPYFYTQAQVKEIVAYAKERHVTIIPEIELPGHAVAAIAAYPKLGNDDIAGFAPKVRTSWGIENYVYAPKEETFQFLDDVIGEVAALFPDAPYIHVGGDECPKTQWDKSPFAQKLMRDNNLLNAQGNPDSHKLQSWFIARVEKTINKHGKKLIGWDEIQEGGLSPTATMMVWRNWKWATEAIKHGNNVVMTPTTHCYFDYSPGNAPKEPAFETIGGGISLEKIYSLDPVPQGLTPEEQKKVLGVQANLWSEYIFNQPKLEYMAFPRAIALSEVGWTSEGRNEADFKQRLEKHLPRLDKLKVNYRKADGAPAQPDAKIER